MIRFCTYNHVLLLCACLLVITPPAWAEVLRLKDGTLVHGDIVEFDEEVGVTLERVDNGGVLHLRWEHLDPAEVKRIKEDRGFTGEEPEAFMVDVVHLVLNNGTTESGILVENQRRDVFTLRQRSGEKAFPKNYVRRVEPGRVEGLVIYAPEDLYDLILLEMGTPVDAESQFNLAVACEGASLYEQGLEHYVSAGELDPVYREELISLRKERLTIKIEDAAETAILDGIRNRLYRKQFEEALAEVVTFRETYPLSRQLGDLEQLEQEVLARRQSHYAGRIISDYFSFLGKSLSVIARTSSMTMEVAVEMVDGSVHDDIMTRLSESYGMGVETLEDMWGERKGASIRTAGYATGTFILGEDKALDWQIGEEESVDSEALEVDDDDDLQDRIEKVLKKRQEERAQRAEAARGNKLLDDGITPEEWWAGNSLDDRQRWLLAYYAEFSTHLEVVRAKPKDCRRCQGEGQIQVLNDKNEYEYITCTVCKGLQVERIVSFR